MALNPQYEDIGKGFVQQYYAIFDDPNQRPGLVNLYNVSTKMSLEFRHSIQSECSRKATNLLWTCWHNLNSLVGQSEMNCAGLESMYSCAWSKRYRINIVFHILIFMCRMSSHSWPSKVNSYRELWRSWKSCRFDLNAIICRSRYLSLWYVFLLITAESDVPKDQPNHHGGRLAANVRRRSANQRPRPITGSFLLKHHIYIYLSLPVKKKKHSKSLWRLEVGFNTCCLQNNVFVQLIINLVFKLPGCSSNQQACFVNKYNYIM